VRPRLLGKRPYARTVSKMRIAFPVSQDCPTIVFDCRMTGMIPAMMSSTFLMNRRQEIALFFIVAAFVATWMFPPWLLTTYDTGSYSQPFPPTPRSQNFGYRFLFTWAKQGAPLGNEFHTIDWGRLFLADLMIAAVGGWLLCVLRSKIV